MLAPDATSGSTVDAVDDTTTIWSVGELADQAGLTVRALHHYDRIGLLVPAERTPAGHRRYGVEEVDRLYRIVALRDLGLGLDEIALSLDGDRTTSIEVARRQLAEVTRRIDELERLRARLEGFVGPANSPAGISAGQVPPPTSTTTPLEITAMTIRLNRITTRVGDGGTTHLGDGSKVAKIDDRIEAIGTIDELNAFVGVASEVAGISEHVSDLLITVQHQLFDLGADVSVPDLVDEHRRIREDDLVWVEERCEELNADLTPLDSFILPGGGELSAQLHVCRTVCRRAERRVVALAGDTPGVDAKYLNRLSDLFFILGRAVSIGNERRWDQDRRR